MRIRAFLIAGFLFLTAASQGATLNLVSDTLSTSEPGVAANHTVKFTAITEIPVSGKIVITPQSGSFNIPSVLDFADVDLLIDNSQKTLAASAGAGSGGAVGVSAVSGTSGSLTFTLNDSDLVSGSSAVIIKIGTNASFGAAGSRQISNPATSGSYKIKITTKNSSGATLDEDDAMTAIIAPVNVSAQKSAAPAPAPVPAPAPAPAPSPAAGGGGGGGPITQPFLPECLIRVADFNRDCRVDLTDFSILLHSWGIPKNPIADINKDGRVDLVDFSIMLYWWTG